MVKGVSDTEYASIIDLHFISNACEEDVAMSYQQHGVSDEISVETQSGEMGEASGESWHSCGPYCRTG